MPNTAHSSRPTAEHLWKKGWVRHSRENAMDRGGGKRDALGIQVAIPPPCSLWRTSHWKRWDIFCGKRRTHAQTGIFFFLQEGSLQGKPTFQEGKTGREMKQQRNCSVMTIRPHTHCSGHEEFGRKQ